MTIRQYATPSLLLVALLTSCGLGDRLLAKPEAPSSTETVVLTPSPEAPPAGEPAPPAPSTEAGAAPAPSRTEGRLIDYRTSANQQGVSLSGASDTGRLEGAPDSFKEFVPREIERQRAENGSGLTMYVNGLHTDGYAIGGIHSSEGGFAAAWAIKNGTWQQIWGGQSVPECAPFRAVGFPAALLAFQTKECYEGGSLVNYGSGTSSSKPSATTSKPTASKTTTSSGGSVKSCEVTSGMRSALKARGVSGGSGLSATCAGNWALLSSDEGGDTQMLLQRTGSGWSFYTGFPSNVCRSEYLSEGGASAYASRLRPC